MADFTPQEWREVAHIITAFKHFRFRWHNHHATRHHEAGGGNGKLLLPAQWKRLLRLPAVYVCLPRSLCETRTGNHTSTYAQWLVRSGFDTWNSPALWPWSPTTQCPCAIWKMDMASRDPWTGEDSRPTSQ